MPLGTAFIRIFVALVLSIPLFFSLGYYLSAAAAEDTLLDSDFVADSLQRSGVYERVYGDVFSRQEFSDWTSGLIGGVEASGYEKEVLLRDVLPPSYIEGETERNFAHLFEYLKGQDDKLDVYVDLNVPLENAKPTALAYLDQRIESLDEFQVSDPEELAREQAAFLITIAGGNIPPYVPSGDAFSSDQRVRAYEQAVDSLAQSAEISPAALANLEHQGPQILPFIQSGDVRSALKMAGRTIAEPHVDQAIDSVRRNGDEQGHLDLVEQVAESSDRTQDQVLRDARIMRFIVGLSTGKAAQWVALGVAVLCVLAMAAVFIPYWKHVLFWPSLALLISGLLVLLIAFSTALDSSFWGPVLCRGRDPGSCQLIVDIGREVASGTAGSFADIAMKIIVTSLVGLAAALVVAKIQERRAS